MPPFHVTVKPNCPFVEPGGGVFATPPVPPAFKAGGVQLAKVEGFLVDDGGDETLLHETVDVSAADAGDASGAIRRSSRRNRDCERSSSERMLHFGGPPWASRLSWAGPPLQVDRNM